jgi:WD40 repeat protein
MSSTNPDDLSNAALNRIDDVCQQFEASWRDGETPRLEEFIRGVSISERTPIFVELFHLELEYRGKRGELYELTTYLDRFPEFGGVVQEIFAQRMSGSTSRIGEFRSFGSGKLPVLHGYAMERQLGRGGMGIVFLARSQKLGRHVAIKMIAHADGSQQVATRFQIEAEAIAKVQHPNIVQIFEVGESGGRFYLVLEFLPGGSLKDRLNAQPPSPRDAARLIEKLARAMHHAHSHGIIHRDLKPSNVLFGADDEPKITDFGLAKLTRSSVEATTTGQILGTVQYMAPEQASASQVSAAADIYALGAILYEMLTHQPPFAGGSPLEILHRLTSADVIRPRKLQADVPPDLEAICLKCLEKEPARRYLSADGLADDLNRFLLGEPVRARPVNGLVRSAKWVRRHPAVSGLLTALVIVALSGFGLVAWKWRDAIQQKDLADSRFEAEKTARAAETVARADAEKSAAAEKRARAAAIRERDWGWVNLHAAQLGRASTEMRLNYVGQARTYLAGSPDPPRGWEHRYLIAECDRRLSVWSEKDIMAIAGADDVLASMHGVQGGRVVIWDVATGKPKRSIPILLHSLSGIAYEPTQQLLAVAGSIDRKGAVMVYDITTGERKHFVRDLPAHVRGVAISPDGRRVACAGCSESLVGAALVDLRSGAVARWFNGANAAGISVAFSPSGERMVTGYDGGGFRIWDTSSGKEMASVAGMNHASSLVFGPDDKWIASAGRDGQVHFFDPSTGRELFTLGGHRQKVSVLAFDRTTRRLASGDQEGNIKIWDIESHRELVNLNSSQIFLYGLSFFDGGTRLAAVDATRQLIEVWNLNRAPSFRAKVPATRALMATKDNLLVYASDKHGVGIRDLNSGQESILVDDMKVPHAPSVVAQGVDGKVAALSPDGKMLAWCGERSIKVWELSTKKELHSLPANRVESVAFHPDGNRIIAAEESGAKIWDLGRREVVHTIPRRWPCIAISPDGALLATGESKFDLPTKSWKGDVDVWDFSTGQLLKSLPDYCGGVNDIAFRPDSKELAAAGRDDAIRIWTVGDWKCRSPLRGHVNGVHCLAYSPDSRRLVSGGQDKTIRIWDTETDRELLALTGHSERIAAVAFHPNRDLLFSSDTSGIIRCANAEPPASPRKP